MSSYIILVLLLAYPFYISAFEKSMTLNTSREYGEGITMRITTPNVVIINNTWHIDPPTQDGTDLELELSREWGFHPSVESTINMTIHGFTPNITKLYGEFLMLFGVGDTQYFSMQISLEQGQAWKSYPSFENKPLAVTTSIFGDIIASNAQIRFHRLANSSHLKDNWEQIGPGVWYKNALEWPLHIQITNDPINDKTYYRCFLPEKTLVVTYTTSFATNQGMKIYIMNEASDGRPFDIYSIHVSYSYTTQSPTSTPTSPPTIPSISPTNVPTTNTPTKSPTTPSPIIVIQPTPSTTSRPTNEGQQIETLPTTTTIQQPVTSSHKSDNLMLYLVIIIIVLLCCFAIFCIGFIMGNKKKKKAEAVPFNAKQYHSAGYIHNEVMDGMNGIDVPADPSLNTALSNANNNDVELVHLELVEENQLEQNDSSSGDELYEKHNTVGMSMQDQIQRKDSEVENQIEGEANELLNLVDVTDYH